MNRAFYLVKGEGVILPWQKEKLWGLTQNLSLRKSFFPENMKRLHLQSTLSQLP